MKVIGQAVAREVGQYPVSPTGACALIDVGQVFDVYDPPGLPSWADEVAPPEPPRQAKASRASKVPSASDIA